MVSELPDAPTEQDAEQLPLPLPAPVPLLVPIPSQQHTTADLSLVQLANAMAASGYWPDVRSAAQAAVRILAGRELGLPPVQSMRGVYLIKGSVALSAGLVAALIKRSGKYDYRIALLTAQQCSLEFLQRSANNSYESVGTSDFSLEDAKRAGLLSRTGSPWLTYPRNMLFARALTNGARWYTPDVFGGPIYTPDELDTEEHE